MNESSTNSGASPVPTALLIIDMQRDFVDACSPLCVQRAAATVDAINDALREARAHGWHVVHVVRSHDASGSDAEPFRRHLFEQGDGYCVKGSRGAEITPRLEVDPADDVVEKTRFSAFFKTRLEQMLRERGVRRLLIAGTQYPNCIRATAVDAISRDLDVVVLTDCCSAADEETEQANIRDLRNMGIQCLDFRKLDL